MAELLGDEAPFPAAPDSLPSADQPFPLPPLRDDLRLFPAPPDKSGAPAWAIHDPVRNRYFRIGHAAFEMLSRWHKGRSDRLVASIWAETVLEPKPEDVKRLLVFLHGSNLLRRDDPEAVSEFRRIAAAGRPPWWRWLVHNYLFIRVPLVRPDRFLQRTQWLADLVAGPWVSRAILLLGGFGLYLVLRQWDLFLATFEGFADLDGLLWLAVTMAATKVLHELGHAYTVRRYGGRVPTMGVAFLVLYPVLYTDTTDAWRLTSREQRLRIGSAGIRVELALALLCTFLWSLLPEGPAKAAAFLIATASWITTLLINLNPFMRFDGYYLLSDWLDVPNLQPRAFALTRWRLREALFGLRLPPPEPMPPRLRRLLVAYGIATWIYRFFLFLAIALIVYHFFFKALGLLLFAVELIWFIALPVAREVREWIKLAPRFRPNAQLAATLLASAAALWLFLHPWNTTIRAPAVLVAAQTTPLIAAQPGRLSQAAALDGQAVRQGDTLYRFEAPELAAQARKLEAELARILVARDHAMADREQRAQGAMLEQEHRRLLASRERLRARAAQLTVTAPLAGTLRDVPPDLRPGLWVGARHPLGRIVSVDSRIQAYVLQEDLSGLSEDAAVTFVPDDASRATVTGTLVEIDRGAAERLEGGYLAAPHGGQIPARLDDSGGCVPLIAVYRAIAKPDAPVETDRTLRGTLHIDGPARSLAARLYRSVAALAIRESGF